MLTSAQIPTIQSPDKQLTLTVHLNSQGRPVYQLSFRNQTVIRPSVMGFELAYQEKTDFFSGFSLIRVDTSTHYSTWEPVLGEEKEIIDHHKELFITVQQAATNRLLGIRFRLFNDGLGFRYEFPAQKNLSYFIIHREKTEFALSGDHKTFWIPGDYDSNEYVYSQTSLSEIKALTPNPYNTLTGRYIANDSLIQTPALMKTANGLYLLVFEAGVTNFPVMFADVDRHNFVMRAHLVPDPSGNAARVQTPDVTPWRTIHVSEKAADLLSSRMTLNLNEPNKIDDVSWIKPMKYVGIWWGMHVGVYSWNYADTNTVKLGVTDWNNLKPNGRHGATTERVKSYIDLAAKHGFDGVLVEGWNVGWEGWSGPFKENIFDFVTPYPDFNLLEISEYAKQKGVKMIMHHETAGGVQTYERMLPEAMALMKTYGYPAVKTGYVGYLSPIKEPHDGQTLTEHYVWVAEQMAKNKLMVNMHESHRLSGVHRTWPNWIASEAARGNEFNAWSQGNPPEHETILPFTRLMGGPLFFAHYSFLGLDPRSLSDTYADYWEQNRAHTLINYEHAVRNPFKYLGYSEDSWGFTASDDHTGYGVHEPTRDNGTISPTAALSSFPYTPEESMKALKHFYYVLGDKLWGQYGFYDAFNPTQGWWASSYLAIDQGPIVVMIENYRSGLLWDMFMKAPEVQTALEKLQFTNAN